MTNASFTKIPTIRYPKFQIRSRWFQAAPQGFLDSYVSELERKLIKQDLDGIRTTLHKIASTAKSCRLIRPTLPGIFPPCCEVSS